MSAPDDRSEALQIPWGLLAALPLFFLLLVGVWWFTPSNPNVRPVPSQDPPTQR